MSAEDAEKPPQPDKVVLYDPTITAMMYQCYWCKRWGEKSSWGPGRTLCPWCKKRAPTGEEFQKLEMLQVLTADGDMTKDRLTEIVRDTGDSS